MPEDIGEILFVQLGTYSNYVGTHLWNLLYIDEQQHYDKIHKSFFLNRIINKKKYYIPRAVCCDFTPIQKYVTIDKENSIEIDKKISWGGEINIIETRNIDTTTNNNTIKHKYWDKLLHPELYYHPRSICYLNTINTLNNTIYWNSFSHGRIQSTTKDAMGETYIENIMDAIRFHAEECDTVQGFILLVDSGAWSGIAIELLQYITQEYHGVHKLCLVFDPTEIFRRGCKYIKVCDINLPLYLLQDFYQNIPQYDIKDILQIDENNNTANTLSIWVKKLQKYEPLLYDIHNTNIPLFISATHKEIESIIVIPLSLPHTFNIELFCANIFTNIYNTTPSTLFAHKSSIFFTQSIFSLIWLIISKSLSLGRLYSTIVCHPKQFIVSLAVHFPANDIYLPLFKSIQKDTITQSDEKIYHPGGLTLVTPNILSTISDTNKINRITSQIIVYGSEIICKKFTNKTKRYTDRDIDSSIYTFCKNHSCIFDRNALHVVINDPIYCNRQDIFPKINSTKIINSTIDENLTTIIDLFTYSELTYIVSYWHDCLKDTYRSSSQLQNYLKQCNLELDDFKEYLESLSEIADDCIESRVVRQN